MLKEKHKVYAILSDDAKTVEGVLLTDEPFSLLPYKRANAKLITVCDSEWACNHLAENLQLVINTAKAEGKRENATVGCITQARLQGRADGIEEAKKEMKDMILNTIKSFDL